MGDMGCPSLYTFCKIGTKHLIEEYNDEIVAAINWVSERMPEGTAMELEAKARIFLRPEASPGKHCIDS